MATSGGHLLVPKAIRLLRFAVEKTARLVRDKLPQSVETVELKAQPAYAKVSARQPISRVAAIRQSQNRWYSTKNAITTSIRHFSSQTTSAGPPSRASYPISRTATAVNRLTSRTPFASTLRPNLTGGTLSRSAGGYGTGAGRVGGVRYFSHSPAAPAQVVNNVSQAVRAFWLSGSKARFDGTNPKTGEKRYRAVSELQDDAKHKLDMSPIHSPGSYLDFKVTPTITAIGPLSTIPRVTSSDCEVETHATTLNNIELMSNLSVDFARALKDLAAIMNDLKHLATLGDLPLSLHDSTTLRVRFPGCDADTVEGLCQELGIRRGIVGQDEDFDVQNGTEMALLFPFAPSKAPSENLRRSEYDSGHVKRSKRDHIDWQEMLYPKVSSSPGYSHHSITSDEQNYEHIDEMIENPWISSPSGYSSLHPSDEIDEAAMFLDTHRNPAALAKSSGYEGLEGIYRFIEECDRAKR